MAPAVAPVLGPADTVRHPEPELTVIHQVLRVEELMFVFGVANALGLARIQKQLIPGQLIPFLRKGWENAKFPYNSPPQAENFGSQFKIMRLPHIHLKS